MSKSSLQYTDEGSRYRDMERDKTESYSALFRNLELRIWRSDSHYLWSVTNSETGVVAGEGEALDRMNAMVAAAETANADWGAVRWRSLFQGSEDD